MDCDCVNITFLAANCRHQQYIGKVKHAVFHTQKTGRKRVLVSTEENVVASLDLRHGEICMANLCHCFCSILIKFLSELNIREIWVNKS